jgi:hypothetical protein
VRASVRVGAGSDDVEARGEGFTAGVRFASRDVDAVAGRLLGVRSRSTAWVEGVASGAALAGEAGATMPSVSVTGAGAGVVLAEVTLDDGLAAAALVGAGAAWAAFVSVGAGRFAM